MVRSTGRRPVRFRQIDQRGGLGSGRPVARSSEMEDCENKDDGEGHKDPIPSDPQHDRHSRWVDGEGKMRDLGGCALSLTATVNPLLSTQARACRAERCHEQVACDDTFTARRSSNNDREQEHRRNSQVILIIMTLAGNEEKASTARCGGRLDTPIQTPKKSQDSPAGSAISISALQPASLGQVASLKKPLRALEYASDRSRAPESQMSR